MSWDSQDEGREDFERSPRQQEEVALAAEENVSEASSSVPVEGGGRVDGTSVELVSRSSVHRREKRTPSPPRASVTPAQRLLLLDTWQRSGLPAETFAGMVGVSKHTLYAWQKRFRQEGPAGLEDQPRGAPRGSRLPEVTKRAILLLKQMQPEWGLERLRDVLLRSEGYQASAGAIRRVLVEAGYEPEEAPTRRHPDRVRRFERARPNQLWQSDLFSFLLKREGRRLHLVVFLDDHSRYVVAHGLGATATSVLVREALESGIANYGPPEEVLTDQGPQYHTWRGKSSFRKHLERRGIAHVLARPRHPQTLGKTERFWGTLWRECLQEAVIRSVEEARSRVSHFIDHYNFQRPHRGVEGLVPADRFFEAASEVRRTLEARVAANALDLARHGTPRKTMYLTGRIGQESITMHGEQGRVVLLKGDGTREEVDLEATGRRAEPEETTEPEPPSAADVCEEGER